MINTNVGSHQRQLYKISHSIACEARIQYVTNTSLTVHLLFTFNELFKTNGK